MSRASHVKVSRATVKRKTRLVLDFETALEAQRWKDILDRAEKEGLDAVSGVIIYSGEPIDRPARRARKTETTEVKPDAETKTTPATEPVRAAEPPGKPVPGPAGPDEGAPVGKTEP